MAEHGWARPRETGFSSALLDDEEIDILERQHPDGMTAQDVVELFSVRGVRLSEATFRKYVQLGLLPRSRRVRRLGMRGGSLGLYPVTVVRRIIEIKRLLAADFTMEEIRQKFLCATSEIDELEESFSRAFFRLEQTAKDLTATGVNVELVLKDLQRAKTAASQLTGALRQAEGRLEVYARGQVNQRMVV